MRIATFNVNGIKARLPRLIEWLEEQTPDIVCLQELKTSDETLPIADIAAAGYHGVWHGQKGFNGVAILARGDMPVEVQRGLGGDPEDDHSRYIEADIFGLRVASIYLPNGNPQPGPKFDYQLKWFDRLHARAADLIMELAVAMEFRASAEDIARICHGHPTYTEAIKEAALDATAKRALHM